MVGKFRKYRETLVAVVFFISLLLTGMATVDDYGISWDEYRNRINGFFAYNYLVNGDNALFDYQDRHYGTAFELPLVFIEKIMGPHTFRDVFLMRHFATFLFFYISCIVFYFLSKRLFDSRSLALLAVVMLVISPRIFADAFYNSKDIVLMGMFIVSFYTMMIFMEKKTFPGALFHAAASAYLVGIRVVGVMLPFFTIFWIAARAFQEKQVAFALKKGSAYLVAFICFTVLFWPYLWPDPAGHFVESFLHMSRYPNIIDILYRGEYVMSDALPWHYLPLWLLITTPPAYSFLFFAGVVGITSAFLRDSGRFLQENTVDFLLLAWFFGPIIVVTALGSTLYDTWRQLFFIYPAFVLLGVKGARSIWQLSARSGAGRRAVVRIGLVGCLAVNMAVVVWFMISHHPHGNVYFNILAGRDYQQIKNRYEMDYWGLAYRQALERIVDLDSRDRITVFAANDPGVLNSFILPEKDRRRIWYVKTPQDADYYITNYRWRKKPYELDTEVFSVDVRGAKIVSVFRLGRPVEGVVDIEPYRGLFFDYFDDPSWFDG